VKIKEFLLDNLAFDVNSKFKIENTSVMAINSSFASHNKKLEITVKVVYYLLLKIFVFYIIILYPS